MSDEKVYEIKKLSDEIPSDSTKTSSELVKANSEELKDSSLQVDLKLSNMIVKSVNSMEKLLDRLDTVDEQIVNSLDLDKLSFPELSAVFLQAKESFKLRQEFIKSLSGYSMSINSLMNKIEDRNKELENHGSENDSEEVAKENEKLRTLLKKIILNGEKVEITEVEDK